MVLMTVADNRELDVIRIDGVRAVDFRRASHHPRPHLQERGERGEVGGQVGQSAAHGAAVGQQQERTESGLHAVFGQNQERRDAQIHENGPRQGDGEHSTYLNIPQISFRMDNRVPAVA